MSSRSRWGRRGRLFLRNTRAGDHRHGKTSRTGAANVWKLFILFHKSEVLFFSSELQCFFFFIFEFITRVMSQKHNIIKLKMIYRINELIFPRSGRLEKLLMLLYTYISSDTGWGGGGMAPTPEPETNQVETQIWK